MKTSMSDPDNSTGPDDSAALDPAILLRQLATQQDDYLRLSADFDNFKKRTRRDAAQQAAAEKEAFILDLLPVLDNMERALACGKSISFEKLHQGVEMTLNQLDQILFRHNIEVIDALGEPFDPHQHDALAMKRDLSQLDHIVLEVVQRGYKNGRKVIRPASVIINDLEISPEPIHAC